MISINLPEVESQLPSLLTSVEKRGEVVVICRNGEPVAELRRPVRDNGPLRQHPVLSRIKFHEDPMAPLDAEDLPA